MLKSALFQVIGARQMVCAGCTDRIERALKTLEGVRRVRADLDGQRIEVLFNAARIETQTLTARLEKIGYQVEIDHVPATDGNKAAVPIDNAQATALASPATLGASLALWRRWLAAITSFLSSAVAIVCPLCIPAFGSLLAAAGLGFAVSTSFLQPLLIAMLLLSIASFAWSARLHRRWWILGPALLGAALVYSGRYLWFSQALMWAGAATLIATSIVNFKIKRGCPRCSNRNALNT